MSLFEFSREKSLAEDLENLFEGRVRVSRSDLMDFLKRDDVEESVESVEIVEDEPEVVDDDSESVDDEVGVDTGSDEVDIVEGGNEDIGIIRYASTSGTHVDMTTENTLYAIIGIRLKSAYIGETIKMLQSNLQIQTASHQVEWMLILNPTVADTFTYVDEEYSAVQIARGATANTVTGGYKITGGFFESGGQQAGAAGSKTSEVSNAIKLGSLIDGTRDTIVLCARPIGGSTAVDIEGSLVWREVS